MVCTPLPLTLSTNTTAELQVNYEREQKMPTPLPPAPRTDAAPELQPRNLDGSWATCDGQYRGGHTFYIIRGKGWGDQNNGVLLQFQIHKSAGGWAWSFQRIGDGSWQLTFNTMILTEVRIERAIKKLYGIHVECT